MPMNTEVLRNQGPYRETNGIADRKHSLVLAIKVLMEHPGIDAKHRRQLIDIALWKYTEASGMNPYPKYNQRYVTDAVRNLAVQVSLNHEHVWPRRWLLDQLLNRKPWVSDDLARFLAEHAVACVVSIEEHGLLGGLRAGGWGRYAAAGVPVWDRLIGAYLNTESGVPAVARPFTSRQPVAPAEQFDLQDLIDHRSGARASLLHRLRRMARFATAVSVVAVNRKGVPSEYFRIHDALIAYPTGAVAYPHWTGKVDFALKHTDVPRHLMGEDSVRTRECGKYAVTCRMEDEYSLELAEELLFLALEKLRASAE